jgi:sugar lactone lactonase YvrE
VRRYDPSGRLIATIRIPVANITKVAFGGPDLRTAYATTAAKGLSEARWRSPWRCVCLRSRWPGWQAGARV